MKLNISNFRFILGIIVLIILYIGYSLINTGKPINEFIGIILIAFTIYGALWLDNTFPFDNY